MRPARPPSTTPLSLIVVIAVALRLMLRLLRRKTDPMHSRDMARAAVQEVIEADFAVRADSRIARKQGQPHAQRV